MKFYNLIALITVNFIVVSAELTERNDNPKTFSSEAGFYKIADSSNSCSNDDLNALSICTSEILSSLDNCKPNDLNCVCCSLQNLDNGCFDLCSDYSSNNILSSITKDCELLSDIDTCELYSKSKNSRMKKVLTPKKSLVEEEDSRTIIKSVFSGSNKKISDEETKKSSSDSTSVTSLDTEESERTSTNSTTINIEKQSGSEGLFTSFKSLCLAVLIILVSII